MIGTANDLRGPLERLAEASWVDDSEWRDWFSSLSFSNAKSNWFAIEISWLEAEEDVLISNVYIFGQTSIMDEKRRTFWNLILNLSCR